MTSGGLGGSRGVGFAIASSDQRPYTGHIGLGAAGKNLSLAGGYGQRMSFSLGFMQGPGGEQSVHREGRNISGWHRLHLLVVFSHAGFGIGIYKRPAKSLCCSVDQLSSVSLAAAHEKAQLQWILRTWCSFAAWLATAWPCRQKPMLHKVWKHQVYWLRSLALYVLYRPPPRCFQAATVGCVESLAATDCDYVCDNANGGWLHKRKVFYLAGSTNSSLSHAAVSPNALLRCLVLLWHLN